MDTDSNLIARYTGLVRAIAKRYPLPEGWERADIEQEGMIGLWNATKRYDPDGLHRSYPFPTVASFAIRTQIRKALRAATGAEVPEIEPAPDIADQPTMPLPLPVTPIHAPTWMQDRITRPLPAIELSEMTPDPAPSVEEQVIALMDGEPETAVTQTALAFALEMLESRQRFIIERRFGLLADGRVWTGQEVADELNCTMWVVYGIQRRTLAKLRAQLDPKGEEGARVFRLLDEKQQQRRVKTRAAA